MTLLVRIGLRWALALSLPLCVYLFAYRGARQGYGEEQTRISELQAGITRKDLQYQEASARILAARPPKPPSPGERLRAAEGLAVPGLDLGVLERREEEGRASLRLALGGGAMEAVSWLEALDGLPCPPRVRSLSLSAEGGTVLLEAGP